MASQVDPTPRQPIGAGQLAVNLDLEAPAEAAGERLDRWLSAQFPAVGRSLVAQQIGDGAITLNGATVKPGLKLKGGERVMGTLAEPRRLTAPRAEAIPLPIVYQDDDVLVIDKPAGLVVHPAPGHAGGTLVNAVLGLWTDDLETEADRDTQVAEAEATDDRPSAETLRPGIVHRLDRDTSGLLVVARHRAAQAALQQQMAARTVLKQYLAIVRGHPASERGTIEAPVGRDPRDRKRMAAVATGRPAVTHFRVVERLAGYSLVEATLATGRTHQIRVHLAAIGHPILGDPVYGVTDPKLPLRRQFLHACRLAFDHPVSGQRLTFESPLPADLAGVLARLRGEAP